MIIRIRTNYGIWKVNIPSTNLTIHEFITSYLAQQYQLSGNSIQNIQLCCDNNSNIKYDLHKTLSDYNIQHGDLIQIYNKLKKIEVEKSYIEDGHLVPAGISYCIDENEKQEVKEISNLENKKLENPPLSAIIEPNKIENPTTKNNDPYAAQVKEPSFNVPPLETNDIPSDILTSIHDYDFSEDSPKSPSIRPPDQSKKMCLYDDDDSDGNLSRILRLESRTNYGGQYHRPRQVEPKIDQEVVEQMRQAGLTESQIQEQINYIMAENSPSDHSFDRLNRDQDIDLHQLLRGYGPIHDHIDRLSLHKSSNSPRNRISEQINDMENRLKQRSQRIGLSDQQKYRKRSDDDQIAMLGKSILEDFSPTKAISPSSHDEIASKISPPTPTSNEIPDHIMRQILEDDKLAELEEQQLLDAINQSKEITAENVVSDDEPLESKPNRYQELSEVEDTLPDEEYDPLLESVLKASLEDAKISSTKAEISKETSIKPRSTARSSEIREIPRKTSQSTTLQESRKKSILESTRDPKPRHTSTENVERISELSRGPSARNSQPTRKAPVPPNLASSSRSSSDSSRKLTTSSRESPRDIPMSRNSPRLSSTQASISSHKPGFHRTTFESQRTAPAPSENPRPSSASSRNSRQSLDSSSLLTKEEEDMVNHAIALSLAESDTLPTSDDSADVPRASSSDLRSNRDLRVDHQEIARSRDHDRNRNSHSTIPRHDIYIDEDEELARAIAQSLENA